MWTIQQLVCSFPDHFLQIFTLFYLPFLRVLLSHQLCPECHTHWWLFLYNWVWSSTWSFINILGAHTKVHKYSICTIMYLFLYDTLLFWQWSHQQMSTKCDQQLCIVCVHVQLVMKYLATVKMLQKLLQILCSLWWPVHESSPHHESWTMNLMA